MSVIEIKTHPITHIIVRDFLDSSSKKKLLNSLLPIRENYLERLIYLEPDETEKLPNSPRRLTYGNKKTAWLYDVLEKNSTLNRDCVDILENNMWRDDLRQAYEDTNNLLARTYTVDYSHIMLSQMEMGGWMDWHNDSLLSDNSKPTCTASYFFQFDNRDCLRGDFLLSDIYDYPDVYTNKFTYNPMPEKIITYPHKDNFLIIYPSNALHRLTKVIGNRYSLLYFMHYRT